MASNQDDTRRKFDVDFSPFRDFMRHMDTYFDRSFRQMNNVFQFTPFPVDVRETANLYIVTAELPGYKRSQIEIEIIGNQLRIAVDNKEEIIDHQGGFHKKSEQKMERVVSVPFEIPEKETKAIFTNGILKIKIPKKNSRRRFIDIED